MQVRDGNLCAYISEPGTYIGVKVRDTDKKYESLLAQSVVAAIIYYILLAGCLFQILNLVVGKPARFMQKLGFGAITFLFLLSTRLN